MGFLLPDMDALLGMGIKSFVGHDSQLEPHTARLSGPGDSLGEGASLPGKALEPPILSGGLEVGGFLIPQAIAAFASKPRACRCSTQSTSA